MIYDKLFHLDFTYINNEEEWELCKRILEGGFSGEERAILYNEKLKDGIVKAPLYLLDYDCGIMKGFFQNYLFAETVRSSLLEELHFEIPNDKGLRKMVEAVEGEKSVSVHFRCGDYLTEKNKLLYGGICDDQYYLNACNYLQKQFDDLVFYVFSDDISLVKERYHQCFKNAVFVTRDMFEEYEDWYDMLLMSKCKHHIIANSTFSWWGAWLDKSSEKCVIAPKRWTNQCVYQDIYPREWMVM